MNIHTAEWIKSERPPTISGWYLGAFKTRNYKWVDKIHYSPEATNDAPQGWGTQGVYSIEPAYSEPTHWMFLPQHPVE